MTNYPRISWFIVCAFILIVSPCFAQGVTVQTIPVPTTTTGLNASSTITATGVFQKVFSATCTLQNGVPTPCRKGCTIQNNGSHTMFVTEGLGIAGSTTSNSAQLSAGQTYNCNFYGVALTGEIDITGTATDAFYAAQE